MGTGTSALGAGNRGDGAQQKAQDVAGQAQEKAQEAAGQAKSTLREQLDQRSTQTAHQINEQAADLRAVGQSLREQGKEGPAKAADGLARYAEKAGRYLQERDSDGLLSDAEDFARRQPWAVGAGALALGFAASRLLKASSSRRYTNRYGGQSLSANTPIGDPSVASLPPETSPQTPIEPPLTADPLATPAPPLRAPSGERSARP